MLNLKKKQEIMSLPCNKSWENWVPKNELIFDFRGQNEAEYNRITIFLLMVKIWENTRK